MSASRSRELRREGAATAWALDSSSRPHTYTRASGTTATRTTATATTTRTTKSSCRPWSRRTLSRSGLFLSFGVDDVLGVGILITCLVALIACPTTCEAAPRARKDQGRILADGGIVLKEQGEMTNQSGVIRDSGGGIQLEEEDGGIDIIEVQVADDNFPKMYQSIPLDVFDEKLRHANSVYDIFRIYYEKNQSDADIDSIMEQQISAARVPWGHSVRPDYRDVITGADRGDVALIASKTAAWGSHKAGSSTHLHLMAADQPPQPPDFHIPYSHSKFTSPKRRSRRHHRRKDAPPPLPLGYANQTAHAHSTHPVDAVPHQQTRLYKHINSSGRRARKTDSQMHRTRAKNMTPGLELAIANVKESSVHQCKPVPVSVPLHTMHRGANKHYAPDCTTVYKCRAESSCCPINMECRPTAEHTISKYFLVNDVTPDGKSVYPIDPSQTKHAFESFDFTNHTECECQDVQSIPECKECHRPFTLTRPNIFECTCGCEDDNRECKKMRRGRKMLQKPYLRCIEEGRCEKPKCQYGQFTDRWLAKGVCPPKHHSTTTTTPAPRAQQRKYTRVRQSSPSRRRGPRRRG